MQNPCWGIYSFNYGKDIMRHIFNDLFIIQISQLNFNRFAHKLSGVLRKVISWHLDIIF